MRRMPLLLLAALLIAGCAGLPAPGRGQGAPGTAGASPQPPPDPPDTVRYIALGDSYTIGTGLARRIDRWPNQLDRALRPAVDLDLVANLALTGNTTFEVIDQQLPDLDQLDPELVSLLIGVNDVIGDVTPEEYRANLALIFDGGVPPGAPRPVAGILDLVPADRVFVVTTPDYTLTPRGGDFARDPSVHAAAIDAFNDILRAEAAARGIAVVDITPISDLVPRDPTLVAADGLHPSGKQYAGWVELIAPVVRAMLPEPA